MQKENKARTMWVLIILGLILLLVYPPVGIIIIIAGVIVLASKKRKEAKAPTTTDIQEEKKKKMCPQCTEEVSRESVVCWSCGYNFPEPGPENPRDSFPGRTRCDSCGKYYLGLTQNKDGKYYCLKCGKKVEPFTGQY